VITAIVLLAFVASLFVFVVGVVPLGRATDERGRAENAADAAALAGATAVHERLGRFADHDRRAFGGPDEALDWAVPGLGQHEAEDFAERNGARLTSYRYNPLADRVEVAVELVDAGVGDAGPANATASAAIGSTIRPCDTRPAVAGLLDRVREHLDAIRAWADTAAGFAPDPDADPPVAPPDAPPTPEPVEVDSTCGGVGLRFELRFDDGRFHLRSVHLPRTQSRLVA
jgi:hypothetical protein